MILRCRNSWSIFYFYSIFQVPKLGTKLKHDSIPLSYTPRKFITHPDPDNHFFYVIEGDHRVWGDEAAAQKIQEMVGDIFVILQFIFLTGSSSVGKESG